MAFIGAGVIEPVLVVMGNDLRRRDDHVFIPRTVRSPRYHSLAGVDPGKIPVVSISAGGDVVFEDVPFVAFVVIDGAFAQVVRPFKNHHLGEVDTMVDPVAQPVDLAPPALFGAFAVKFPIAYQLPAGGVGLDVGVGHAARAADLEAIGRPGVVGAGEQAVDLRVFIPGDVVGGVSGPARYRLSIVVGFPVDPIGGVAQGRANRGVRVAGLVAVRRVFFMGVDIEGRAVAASRVQACLLYTSPSPRDGLLSRMPSSA